MTLKIEGKSDRIAKSYKFIFPIFGLDKPSLHQGYCKRQLSLLASSTQTREL